MCGADQAGAAFLRGPGQAPPCGGQAGNIALRGADWAGATGRHRRERALCGVRTNSLPRAKRGYVGDILWETMPVRTKPEGWIPVMPGSVLTVHFLLLTRPVRCREGQTADDAVLTLIFLISTTGAAFK
jgi:hypothetical protein